MTAGGCHGYYSLAAITATGNLLWFAGSTQTNGSVTPLRAEDIRQDRRFGPAFRQLRILGSE